MTPLPTARRRRVSPRVAGLVAAVAAILLVAGLGLLITLRGTTQLDLDAEWMAELLERRIGALVAVALLFDWLGGGIVGVFVVPIGIAVLLLVRRRPWGALAFVLASALSAGLVQVIKHLFGRERPVDILVVADYGSFPSGHTANAATIAVVLGLILQRRWVWIAGLIWTIGMLLARTYVGAHWLTDTLGGSSRARRSRSSSGQRSRGG
ncbi:phosphatase PAP2 family protein [Homoserinibacter sp. YIM 151385]|uniref:phosphatase PAP2 family protein n=1 Tax=Homoserinibacter sp. YIM 151385 TaxID=2985506 RepID=UPI0022F10D6E|nr:phosphatase PAP2 family protein [Homoserinibacter sp. YIM 151385]WBU36898.1 phosphatase PAP2 family protein [Homoserinibacter sp. YIM 151385]